MFENLSKGLPSFPWYLLGFNPDGSINEAWKRDKDDHSAIMYLLAAYFFVLFAAAGSLYYMHVNGLGDGAGGESLITQMFSV